MHSGVDGSSDSGDLFSNKIIDLNFKLHTQIFIFLLLNIKYFPMRVAKKKNRKYLIGAGKINTRYQLERIIRSMIINSNPNVQIVDVKLRYCGKNKMFNIVK